MESDLLQRSPHRFRRARALGGIASRIESRTRRWTALSTSSPSPAITWAISIPVAGLVTANMGSPEASPFLAVDDRSPPSPAHPYSNREIRHPRSTPYRSRLSRGLFRTVWFETVLRELGLIRLAECRRTGMHRVVVYRSSAASPMTLAAKTTSALRSEMRENRVVSGGSTWSEAHDSCPQGRGLRSNVASLFRPGKSAETFWLDDISSCNGPVILTKSKVVVQLFEWGNMYIWVEKHG